MAREREPEALAACNHIHDAVGFRVIDGHDIVENSECRASQDVEPRRAEIPLGVAWSCDRHAVG